MTQTLRCGLMALLLTGVCAVECAAKKRPQIPPNPQFMAIQNIAVLPIVDARAGKKAGVNMGKLQGSVVKLLKRKRYPVSAASASGETGEIVEEDLQSGLPPYVKKLGPVGERWVMVVCLRDVASKITFGSTGNAEISGYLFDKDSGGLVWQGKGVGQAGQGGLMGMTMKGMMKGEAIDFAVYNLFRGMPDRPKPGM
jgi:hypothetical protein